MPPPGRAVALRLRRGFCRARRGAQTSGDPPAVGGAQGGGGEGCGERGGRAWGGCPPSRRPALSGSLAPGRGGPTAPPKRLEAAGPSPRAGEPGASVRRLGTKAPLHGARVRGRRAPGGRGPSVRSCGCAGRSGHAPSPPRSLLLSGGRRDLHTMPRVPCSADTAGLARLGSVP